MMGCADKLEAATTAAGSHRTGSRHTLLTGLVNLCYHTATDSAAPIENFAGDQISRHNIGQKAGALSIMHQPFSSRQQHLNPGA